MALLLAESLGRVGPALFRSPSQCSTIDPDTQQHVVVHPYLCSPCRPYRLGSDCRSGALLPLDPFQGSRHRQQAE